MSGAAVRFHGPLGPALERQTFVPQSTEHSGPGTAKPGFGHVHGAAWPDRTRARSWVPRLAGAVPSGHGFMSAAAVVSPPSHCSTARQASRPQPVAKTSQSPLLGSRAACGVEAL